MSGEVRTVKSIDLLLFILNYSGVADKTWTRIGRFPRQQMDEHKKPRADFDRTADEIWDDGGSEVYQGQSVAKFISYIHNLIRGNVFDDSVIQLLIDRATITLLGFYFKPSETARR